MSSAKRSKRPSGHARRKAARLRKGDVPGGPDALARMLSAYIQITEGGGPVYDKMVTKRWGNKR